MILNFIFSGGGIHKDHEKNTPHEHAGYFVNEAKFYGLR